MQFVVAANVSGLSFGSTSYPAAGGFVSVPDNQVTAAMVAAFRLQGAIPASLAAASGSGSSGGSSSGGSSSGGSTTITGTVQVNDPQLSNTLQVGAAALPLPAGAATEATLAGVNTKLGGTLQVAAAGLPLPSGAATEATIAALNTKITALLAAESPPQGEVAMVPDVAQAAQRAVKVLCTAVGNVSLTYADGSVGVFPVQVGLSVIGGAFTRLNSSGTTATATLSNLK